MNLFKRIFGQSDVPTPVPEQNPKAKKKAIEYRNWEDVAQFIADGMIRPMARGHINTDGLTEVNFTRVEDYCLGQTGDAFEHPSGGMFLARLNGEDALFVFTERMSGSPTALPKEEFSRFLPAGSNVSQVDLHKDQYGLTLKAVLPETLTDQGVIAHVILTLFDYPIDNAWIAQITCLRASPRKVADA